MDLSKSPTISTPKASPKAKIPKSPLQRTPGKKSLNKSLTSTTPAPSTKIHVIKEEISSESEDVEESSTEDKTSAEEITIAKTTENKKRSAEAASDGPEKKKIKDDKDKEYTLFVGKLNQQITEGDIKVHFGKVAAVASVRIPTFKDSGKKRLFAFVGFKNQKDYEAALALHQSHLKGSCITVEYTCAGSKKSTARANKIKSKTLKLRSLQKKGILSSEDDTSTSLKKKKKNKKGKKATTEKEEQKSD